MAENAQWLDERDGVIIAMRAEGKSLRLISEATGLSEGAVGHRIKRLELPLHPTNPRKADIDRLVAEKRAGGALLVEIAETLGVNAKTIARRAEKLGLEDPYAGKVRPRRARRPGAHDGPGETAG